MSIDERRGRPRAAVVGSAIVLAGDRYAGTYVLENLSASGALLVGDTRLAVGAHVRLLLQPHGRCRRLALEAHVVRRTAREGQTVFAVQFARVPPSIQDALQSIVLRQLADPHTGGLVLIVDAGPEDAARLQRDIREARLEAAVAHTALDAVIRLQCDEGSVTAVIVGAALPEVDGLGLLEFIGEDYPATRRVLACDGDFARRHRDALASGRLHAMLERPWTRESLLRALGLSP